MSEVRLPTDDPARICDCPGYNCEHGTLHEHQRMVAAISAHYDKIILDAITTKETPT